MYKGKDNELYADLEETILACLLIKPELIEELKVEEKHFTKFGYVLTFFKKFYTKHRCLDISLMFSVLKGSSEMKLLDIITYLLDIFALPTHFEEYQRELITNFEKNKKKEWVVTKIYDKASDLYMGNMELDKFYEDLIKLKRFLEKGEQ